MSVALLSLPILITLLLSGKLIFIPNQKSSSSRLLGVFFLFFSIALASILFQYLQEFYPYIKTRFYIIETLFYAIMLGLPVIVYFYIVSLTDYINNYTPFIKGVIHFFIPLQALLFSLYPYLDEYYNTDSFVYKATEYTNFFSLKVTFILFNIFYITRSLYLYQKHRSRVKDVLSYDKGISFKWITVFTSGYLLFVLCFFALNPNSSPYLVYLPFLLIITYLYFQRNTQVTVSLEDQNAEKERGVNLNSSNQSSTINTDKRKELQEKIISFMENEEPYLKSDLTIYDLAKMLNTNNSYLSIVLNNDFNSSFVSYINSYRINKSKELLIDNQYDNYTIEAIGELVGFNSKSAFNRAFKKFVNQTPSVYRKSLNK